MDSKDSRNKKKLVEGDIIITPDISMKTLKLLKIVSSWFVVN